MQTWLSGPHVTMEEINWWRDGSTYRAELGPADVELEAWKGNDWILGWGRMRDIIEIQVVDDPCEVATKHLREWLKTLSGN